jgi:hypothetical protein
MIDAKILKPPTDFTFNQNQKEIDEILKAEPLIRDCHSVVKKRIESSYN